jgi:hypothetical protein
MRYHAESTASPDPLRAPGDLPGHIGKDLPIYVVAKPDQVTTSPMTH